MRMIRYAADAAAILLRAAASALFSPLMPLIATPRGCAMLDMPPAPALRCRRRDVPIAILLRAATLIRHANMPLSLRRRFRCRRFRRC